MCPLLFGGIHAGLETQVADPLAYLFYWLGLSIGMHSFPSTQDLQVIRRVAPPAAKRGNILAIVSYPVVALLYVANFARVLWADLGYGILVGILGPLAVFKALA